MENSSPAFDQVGIHAWLAMLILEQLDVLI
jgi:hypothetical protein